MLITNFILQQKIPMEQLQSCTLLKVSYTDSLSFYFKILFCKFVMEYQLQSQYYSEDNLMVVNNKCFIQQMVVPSPIPLSQLPLIARFLTQLRITWETIMKTATRFQEVSVAQWRNVCIQNALNQNLGRLDQEIHE